MRFFDWVRRWFWLQRQPAESVPQPKSSTMVEFFEELARPGETHPAIKFVNFVHELALDDPELRDILDDMYLEFQTDESPTSDKHAMIQDLRDDLQRSREGEPKDDTKNE